MEGHGNQTGHLAFHEKDFCRMHNRFSSALFNIHGPPQHLYFLLGSEGRGQAYKGKACRVGGSADADVLRRLSKSELALQIWFVNNPSAAAKECWLQQGVVV